MTKEQVIQAVLNKAREKNISQGYTYTTIAELYERCEKELGTERFKFYEKHHRLTDLLYKLLNNSIALNDLKTLDQFSLENDRVLPRLLQADENELSSSPKEIAEYDLFEYDPMRNMEQKKLDYDDNKAVYDFLNFVFHITTLIAEKRVKLYQKLKPFSEELQQHRKRLKELKDNTSLDNWKPWMLPSSTEKKYIEEKIAPFVLLEKKIDMFTLMVDEFCCALRSFEQFPIRNDDYNFLFHPPSEEDFNRGAIYISYDKVTLKSTYTIKTPDGIIVTDSLSERDKNLPTKELLHLILEEIISRGHAKTKSALKDLYYGVHEELFKYSQYNTEIEEANGSNAYRMEKIPEQFENPLPDDCRTPMGRKANRSKHSIHFTECDEDKFCIYQSTSNVFSERRNDMLFHDFMRGLAGIVLVPLRGLFHAAASLINYCFPSCQPENAPLQKQAFYKTQSSYFLYQTYNKLLKKDDEISLKYINSEKRIDGFDQKDFKPVIKNSFSG